MSQERKALDSTAVSVMLLLTALWGFQQVTVKLIAADVSLLMQAAIRSGLATALLVSWAWVRGIALFERDATLWPGIGAGLAAIFWASTTVLIRATRLARATATKTLFYQLSLSAVVLLLASAMLGEKGVVSVTPLAVASLAYQGAIVAFASYLAWFWLLTRYLATRLSVLSFLTPLFGVLSGVVFLSEPLSGAFAAAALLVGAGIVLVNMRA